MKKLLTKLAIVFLCLSPLLLKAQTSETFASGAFIVDMGVVPQTFGNGLKPYGLLYDLIKNYSVPIKWVYSSTKTKDGIDFTYNSTDYKGGPFIIPSEYRSAAVNARITYWQGQGVAGTTTTSSFTVPVQFTLRTAPNWTINTTNASIAINYLTTAGIPASAYNMLLPDQLTCCNDLFVMPHSDPTWATHNNLLTWNQTCKGGIWAGCHAASVVEGLFDPADTTRKMNFLSTPLLLNYQNHSAGSPPYTYNNPADAVMQFMGTYDGAQQNGSEQIYLPVSGGAWRPTTRVEVNDPTQTDVPAKSPGPAATTVFGRAFGDNSRGYILYEAGHDFSKSGTTAEQVSAERVFLNFSFLEAVDKEVLPILSAISDTMYSGTSYAVTFTLQAPALVSDYTILWSSVSGGTFTPNSTQQTVNFTPSSANGTTTIILGVQIKDACGRTFTTNKVITVRCSLTATTTTTNPIRNGGTGSIALNVSGGTAPYSYNWNNGSATGSGTGTTISGLLAGTYAITITSANGCSTTTSATVTEPPVLSVTPTVTNGSCNGNSNGAISISVSGGTPPYTYSWSTGATTSSITGLANGTYSVTVTDYNNVTATSSASVNCTCPTLFNPSAAQSVCVGGAGSNITVNTTIDSTNSIKFIKFTTEQIAGATPTAAEAATIYAGPAFATVTPTSSSSPYTGTYNYNAADFPNASASTITYYVYAVLNPDGGTSCRPVQEIKINVNPVVSISSQPMGITECLTGTQSLSVTAAGGYAPLSYQWQNITNGGTTWANISGATSNIYTPPSSTTGTVQYRVAVASNGGTGCNPAISNAVPVNIVSPPTVVVTASSATICSTGNVLFSASSNVIAGTCAVQWQSSPDGTAWSNISGASGNNYSTSLTTASTSKHFRAQLVSCTGSGCCN